MHGAVSFADIREHRAVLTRTLKLITLRSSGRICIATFAHGLVLLVYEFVLIALDQGRLVVLRLT